MRPLVFLLLTMTSAAAAADFELGGYFKDDLRNRVMAFRAPPGATREQVEMFATSQNHTPGQVTAVFIFPHDARLVQDGLTLASDYLSAVNLMFALTPRGWRWVSITSPRGQTNFQDCEAEPEASLCATD